MGTQAGVYVRISQDDGRALGVERQRQDCERLAESLGWTVVRTYTDNDISAFAGKRRPAYEQLLEDLESEGIDALVCWDVDRLTRTPVELEDIIDLAERRNVSLASVGGDIDLATPQGRLTARIKASVARHEVEQASRRIRRKTLERAQNGQPHGRTAYGWRREVNYDENGRRAGSCDVLVPEQAAIIREIADRIIAGESMRSITLDLQRRGELTPNGRTSWHPVTVRQLVLRERNAGLRRHQKQVIGRGNWEPILDEETYDRVRAILTDPGRRTSPTSTHRHLLSGIALCGVCDHPVRILMAHGTHIKRYVCPSCFGVARKQEAVDQLISGLVVARLSQPDALEALAPTPQDVRPALEEIATLRARLDLAADQFADGQIDGVQLARITSRPRQQLEQLESEVRRASVIPDLVDLARPDVRELWDDLPLERRRAVINLLMTIRILAVGKTGRAEFDPDGISVEWKTAAASAAAPTAPPTGSAPEPTPYY